MLTASSKLCLQSLSNFDRVYFKEDNSLVTDTQSLVNAAEQSLAMLLIFFTIVGVVALLLCFFILVLSVTANVRENKWELGVLRSLGLSQHEVVFIYVAESFVVVLSSMIIGVCLGIAVSITLTLQMNVFLEIPFKYEFPWVLFSVMFSMGLVTSIFGSYFPSMKVARGTISATLSNH